MAVVDLKSYPPFVLPVPRHAIHLPPDPLPFWWCDPYQRYLLDLSFSQNDLTPEELNWLHQNYEALLARIPTARLLRLIAEFKDESLKQHPELHEKLQTLTSLALLHNKKIVFCQNQLLEELEKRSVPSFLIKGAALIRKIPDTIYFRNIGDVDFFIPENKVKEVLEHLVNLGCRFAPNLLFGKTFNTIDSLLPFRHSFDLFDPHHQVGLDLHWHLCPQSPNSKFDQILGALKVTTSPSKASKTLEANEMFLLAIVHALGDRWNQPQSHWVIDTLALARYCPNEIDWKKIFWLAKKTEYVAFIQLALKFLHEIDPETIPQTWIKKSKRLRLTFKEKLDRFFLTQMRRNVELRGL